MDKAEIDAELAAHGKFQIGQVIGGKWKIVQKLDEGGFGCVYKVQHVANARELAALKVERANNDEINYLKLETAVLKELHAAGMRPHVPELYRSAKHKHYCYIIITLLGDNLKKLKDKHFAADGMPLRTWARVGVQCLYGLKTMHDRGFVHRDVKAQNFVLGFAGTPAVARVVYVIDFGLARAYAYAPTTAKGKWLARKARAHLDFRGTWRYAAPSMHEEAEQGRKDDLWSWLYMMMDLYCGLPWDEDETKEAIERKKLHMSDDDLMIRMPEELKFIPKQLRKLDVYQRPDYASIYAALETVRKKQKVSYEDAYEWESREAAATNKRAMVEKRAPTGYTAAEAFFKSDPIRISRAPNKKEMREMAELNKTKTPDAANLEDVLTSLNIPLASAACTPTTTATSQGTSAKTTATAVSCSAKPPTIPTQQPLASAKKSKSKSAEKQLAKATDKKLATPAKTAAAAAPSPAAAQASQMAAAFGMPPAAAAAPKTKRKSRASTRKASPAGKRGGSSEDSLDFVPSCYMTLPQHYQPPLQQKTKSKDHPAPLIQQLPASLLPQHSSDPSTENPASTKSEGNSGQSAPRVPIVHKAALLDDPTLAARETAEVSAKKDEREREKERERDKKNSDSPPVKSVYLSDLPTAYQSQQAQPRRRSK